MVYRAIYLVTRHGLSSYSSYSLIVSAGISSSAGLLVLFASMGPCFLTYSFSAESKAFLAAAASLLCYSQFHNDAITLSNPIGVKRGEHKLEEVGAAIVNLPKAMRYSWRYIMLLAVRRASPR